MASGNFTVSVAAVALLTAFALPSDLPYFPTAEAAEATQERERQGRGQRGGDRQESRGPRGGSESRGQRGGGDWQSRREAAQSAPQQSAPPRQQRQQQVQSAPSRPQPSGAPQRSEWQGNRGGNRQVAPSVSQQPVPGASAQNTPQREWQGRRGGAEQGRDTGQRREWQSGGSGADRREAFQQRRQQAQSGAPSQQIQADARQTSRREWESRRDQGQQWQGRRDGGSQWQGRQQSRTSYRHQHYNVRYDRSRGHRAPVIYNNHYYVNRYSNRSIRWTPPVRIVHHHVHHYPGWTYHPRWHSSYARQNFYYTDGVCRTNGGNVVAGALVGALLGAAISDGDASGLLAGGLIGAGLGVALSDCDRGQYHYATHYAFSTGNPYYWHNPYSGVRGVVYARDFHNWGSQRCRWGDAEIFLPNGEVAYDRVRMCQDQYGYWQVAPIQ